MRITSQCKHGLLSQQARQPTGADTMDNNRQNGKSKTWHWPVSLYTQQKQQKKLLFSPMTRPGVAGQHAVRT